MKRYSRPITDTISMSSEVTPDAYRVLMRLEYVNGRPAPKYGDAKRVITNAYGVVLTREEYLDLRERSPRSVR